MHINNGKEKTAFNLDNIVKVDIIKSKPAEDVIFTAKPLRVSFFEQLEPGNFYYCKKKGFSFFRIYKNYYYKAIEGKKRFMNFEGKVYHKHQIIFTTADSHTHIRYFDNHQDCINLYYKLTTGAKLYEESEEK